MREKLETLTLAALRDLAKQNGIKSVTTMKKSELIDALLGLAEEQVKEKNKSEEKPKEKAKAEAKTEPKPHAGKTDEEKQEKKPVGRTVKTPKKKIIVADNTAKAETKNETKNAESEVETSEKKDLPDEDTDDNTPIEANGILEVMQDGFGFIR